MEMSSVIFGSVEEGFGDIESSEVEFVYESAGGHSRLGKTIIGDKIVCIKALKEEYIGNPIYEGLLEKEYEIGAALDHPNICRTLISGVSNNSATASSWSGLRERRLKNCCRMGR